MPDDDIRELWQAVTRIEGGVTRIEIMTARIEERMEAHAANSGVHAQPRPCQPHVDLRGEVTAIRRGLWATVVAAISGLAGALWSIIREQ